MYLILHLRKATVFNLTTFEFLPNFFHSKLIPYSTPHSIPYS